MKRTQFTTILTLLFVSTVYLPFSSAQDYTTWELPEGAKARLGKGALTLGDNIAYSSDGTRLAVASSIGIWLYDAQTYQELSLFTGDMFRVISVAFSPDGQTLAGSGWDITSFNCTIRLWDVETGEHKRTLQGHTDGVYSVAFSPDGQILTSGSSDGTVLLWNITPTAATDPRSVNAKGKHYMKWGTLKTAEVFQNYPNPFNPETWIPYTLFETSNVKLSIFASNGELIREFKLGYQSRGPKRIHWDGKNTAGETVASSIYFYQFEAGRTKSVRKMWLLK